MVILNNMGIIVIEALRTLKEPATFNTIVSTVATFLDCADKDVLDAVKIALEGGVQYGYVLKRGQKFAFKVLSAVPSNVKMCEWKSSYDEINKNHVCKIKPIKLVKDNESKIEIFRNKTNKNYVKTLFKAIKPIKDSGELSVENSEPYCVAKQEIRPFLKMSAKSLSVNGKFRLSLE